MLRHLIPGARSDQPRSHHCATGRVPPAARDKGGGGGCGGHRGTSWNSRDREAGPPQVPAMNDAPNLRRPQTPGHATIRVKAMDPTPSKASSIPIICCSSCGGSGLVTAHGLFISGWGVLVRARRARRTLVSSLAAYRLLQGVEAGGQVLMRIGLDPVLDQGRQGLGKRDGHGGVDARYVQEHVP